MNKNYKNIFSESECPSHEEIAAYCENKLTGAAKHAVEKHFESCAMCREEAEGLAELINIEVLDHEIETLNNEIDERIKKISRHRIGKTKKQPELRIRRAMSIAASIILLFGIGFLSKILFFDNNLQEEYASAEYAQDKTISPAYMGISSGDSVVITRLEPETKKMRSEIDRISPKTAKKDEITANFSSTAPVEEIVVAKEESPEDKIGTNDTKEENLVAETKSEKEIVSVESDDEYTNRNLAGISDISKKNVSENYNSGTTVNSADQKESKKMKADTDDIMLSPGDLFLEAKELYDKGQYELALGKFRTILETEDSRLWDDARWFEAMSLFKLNRKKEAKKVFEKISKTDSYYKKQALEKIQEIK